MNSKTSGRPPIRRKRHGQRNRARIIVACLGAAGVIAAGSGLAYAATAGHASAPPGNGCLGLLPACSGHGIPAAKAAVLRKMAQRMAAARRHPFPKPAMVSPVPQAAQPPRVESLSQARQSPLPSQLFAAMDSWQGPVGGRWVIAYAGTWAGTAAGARPVGAVALYDEPVNPNAQPYLHMIGVARAPAGDRSLTIVSYRGDLLTLKNQANAVIHFNVATHTFS